MADEPRGRGLQAVDQAREARSKMSWPSPKFWGYAGLILAISAIIYWKRQQGEFESARQTLMAKQRAVALELGPRWNPMRDRIEAWTMELAREPGSEVVNAETLGKWDFREKGGVYLRLRVDDAKSVEAIRKNAKDSLRDAFTSCMVRFNNPNPLAGPECKKTRDCPAGDFCNEMNRCSRPAQPFNLRVAYRTLHVLSDDWVRDVQDAGTDLRFRLLSASFEDTTRDDIPLAVEFLTRAQYFLLVLDEAPEGAEAPKATESATAMEALQAVPHMARVGVWNMADGKLLLRVRREASGQLLGAPPAVDPEVLDARQRQANSCALALAVRTAMGDADAAPAPPPGVEAPAATGTAAPTAQPTATPTATPTAKATAAPTAKP